MSSSSNSATPSRTDFPVYVVQHMESDLSPWVLAEYSHISQKIPKERVVFTTFPSKTNDVPDKLKDCTLTEQSVEDFIPADQHQSVCLLDEDAPAALSPSDASWVKYILIGGILGDEDVDDAYQAVDRDRTRDLRKWDFPRRHLGDKQMTLDHAALVAKEVLEGKKELEKMEWVDRPWFDVGEKEQIQIPFRYLAYPPTEKPPADLIKACGNKPPYPMMAPGLLEIIRDDGGAEQDDDEIWG